ncbi:MAG TPA: TIGR01777 family oxidoreductase [Terriglobales bacterium]|nr:TIGR01777 family oxidoreductase [Terriglobales bacterium]
MNRLRIVLPGGSGQIGTLLSRHFHAHGHDVVTLTRKAAPVPWRVVEWDGESLGHWVSELENSDVVINLAGKGVNCRYTAANREAIKESRMQTTRLLGKAIGKTLHPRRLWMNASTATIYRHSYDRPMDEQTGEIGGNESDAPSKWKFSIDVATSWEAAFFEAVTPNTRKVALRSAMIMSPDRHGVFDTLLRLVRFGLGGTTANGRQFISWIHDADFISSIEYLIALDELSGTVNLASPNPVPNREFMRALRQAWGTRIGLPAAGWMLEIATVFLRTETELVLKSRRVIPRRLLESGFRFQFPDWHPAAQNLVARWRATHKFKSG